MILLNEDACKESYVIINYLIESGEIVIPQAFINKLCRMMNKNYDFNINDINNVTLHEDTNKILSYVFFKYMMADSEKEKIAQNTKTLKDVIYGNHSETPSVELKTVAWSDKLLCSIKKLFPKNKIKE